MRPFIIACTVVIAANLLCTACARKRVGEPLTEPIELSSTEEEQGEILFMRYCHQCHPDGAGGLGPSINDKPMPRGFVRAQVRLGVGAMPPFPEEVLSDPEVDAITAYVALLHRHARAADDS